MRTGPKLRIVAVVVTENAAEHERLRRTITPERQQLADAVWKFGTPESIDVDDQATHSADEVADARYMLRLEELLVARLTASELDEVAAEVEERCGASFAVGLRSAARRAKQGARE